MTNFLATATSSEQLLAGLAVVLASACVYFHLRKFSYWSSRGVAGPRPWPIFGTNIYYILASKLEVDQKWRRQYGKTYGLYEGYSPMLRTSDNEVVKQVYIKKFSSFTDRHNEFIYDKVQRNWLLWSEGERWANQRALVSPMFSSARMRQMIGTMSACVERFLDQARTRSPGPKDQAGGAKVATNTTTPTTKTLRKRDLSNMTLDVIATTFFGLKLDTYGDQQNEFLLAALEFTRLQLSRFLAWTMVPRHLARLLSFDLFPRSKFMYFDLLTKRIIEERRRGGGSQSPSRVAKSTTGGSENANNKQVTAASAKDFVQLFLEARLPESYEPIFGKDDDQEAHYNDRQGHEQLERQQREQTDGAKLFKRFSDLEIRGQMSFMFLAGFETTATTIGFCIYELGHQPATQARLFGELGAALGSKGLATLREARANLPEEFYSKLISLPVLDAFVSETLRLYTPLVEHNRRVTQPEGAELSFVDKEGREHVLKLPRGLPISTQGFVLQRDGDLFEEPDTFKLERFLPENRDAIKTCSFMPFGVGPRHCAGMRFALLEVKLALAKMLASYTLAPGPQSRAYPPAFQRNPIFLQLEHTDFQLTPRAELAA